MATRAWGWDSRSCSVAPGAQDRGNCGPLLPPLAWAPVASGENRALKGRQGPGQPCPWPPAPSAGPALSSFVWKRGAVGEIGHVLPPPAASGPRLEEGDPLWGKQYVLTLLFYLCQSPES